MTERWHEMVKKALKEIGKERGYDVSQSDREIILASKFSMYKHQIEGNGQKAYVRKGEERKIHTLSYKPDVIWKKKHLHRAIFEIEYLRKDEPSINKRKYAIGSFMLGYMAMFQKSAKFLVFVTNNMSLYNEITTFGELIPIEHSNIHTACIVTDDKPNTIMTLKKLVVEKWKI